MILKKPQQARRVASGVTVHDLNLIHSVPGRITAFSSSVPGRMTPDRRRPSGGLGRPPAAVPIPHAEEKKEKDHDP